MWFTIFLSFVITQRVVELIIARRNEWWLKKRGAIEYYQEHYKYIVFIHIGFLASFLLEVIGLQKSISPLWPGLVLLFLLTQLLRVWAITSLGSYWNTKIIILPNVNIVAKGPYKFLRHPNYFVVCIEIIIIPLMFQAYWTAIIFSLLNAWILSIRIPLEEKALLKGTANYDKYIEQKSRFTPTLKKFTE